jgi:hypothetical protein
MITFSYSLIPILLDFTNWILPIWVHFRKASPWGVSLLDFLLLLRFLFLLFLFYFTWADGQSVTTIAREFHNIVSRGVEGH